MPLKIKKRHLEEIEAELSDVKQIPCELRYAMGMLGLDYCDVKPLSIDDIEGDKEEKTIQFEFLTQQRRSLLAELIEAKRKVIEQGLGGAAHEQALADEEEQHLHKLLSEEDKKLKKIFSRQDRETRMIVAEQLSAMDKQTKQLAVQEKEELRRRHKADEERKALQEKLEKKQTILERRRKAEELQREQERKRYLEALQKQEDNDRMLVEERKKKEALRQSLILKRIEEVTVKKVDKERKIETLNSHRELKESDILSRYDTEKDRYRTTVKARSAGVHRLEAKRKQRQTKLLEEKQLEEKQRQRFLKQKREAEEERLRQFQLEKEKARRKRKAERQKKMNKTLCAAKDGEESRLKKIDDDAKRAEQNRMRFLKQKQREDQLKRLVSTLKNQAAVDAAERKTRAKLFQGKQLAKKAEREDARRMKDLVMRKVLKEQRMKNGTTTKLRQKALKERIAQIGSKEKLLLLERKLEDESAAHQSGHTTIGSPITKKSMKVKVVLSPRKIDSSIARKIQTESNKLKASIYRESK